jgi:hypothetical protein
MLAWQIPLFFNWLLEGAAVRNKKVITSRNLSLDIAEVGLSDLTNPDMMQKNSLFVNKKPVPFVLVSKIESVLVRHLGQCAEGTSRNAQFHTPNTLGLEIDTKGSARGSFGMTNFVTGLCSASGKLTGSAHNVRS